MRDGEGFLLRSLRCQVEGRCPPRKMGGRDFTGPQPLHEPRQGEAIQSDQSVGSILNQGL